jgi:uncharacterized Zn finger protein
MPRDNKPHNNKSHSNKPRDNKPWDNQPRDDKPWDTPWAKPVKVDGGLRARSKRGSIGSTWWSRRFIDILERICDKGRLSRGRAYARAGQVLSIDLAPGLVTAAVQGSRREPYEITIAIEAYDETRWNAIEEAIAAQAVHRAKLLAGEMPEEIEEVFAGLGLDLFPRELDMECSCPDWGWPCKHLSAVLYLLAESFDGDPFLVLAWRGRSLDDLQSSLNEEPQVVDVPFADRLADFYAPGATVHRPERRAAVQASDLLPRVFPPPRGLTETLTAAYRRLGELD